MSPRRCVEASVGSRRCNRYGRMRSPIITMVRLTLRGKEYEVQAGMTLLAALEKVHVLPESVIATREGELILEDEILRDGEVIKLVAVISGGQDGV